MKPKPINAFCTPFVVVAGLLVLAAAPVAAVHLETTAELGAACEESPGNVVELDHSTKILDGLRPPATEQVASGCTIVLGPGANFETEQISMTFAGPLVVHSAQKAEVKLIRSFFTATAINFNLTGTSSAIETILSGLHATTGSLLVTLGEQSKLIVLERLLPGPDNALAAASTVQIRGGQRFTGLLSEMGISAPRGFQVTMDGAEGLLKAEHIHVATPQGSIGITASGAKGLVEMSESNLDFGDMMVVRLAGADSLLKLKQVAAGGEVLDAPGGVTLEAGSAGAGNGKIEASEISLFNVSSITLLASLSGQKGGLKLEKSSLSATGDIVLETGAQGVTEVKENSGGSDTRIRVAAGSDGECVAQSNSFFALVLEICP